MKDPASLAQHNLTYNPAFHFNITKEFSGVHVPTDIYEKGEVSVLCMSKYFNIFKLI